MELPPIEEWKVATWVKEHLNDIRYGNVEDTHGWNVKV
jgi:hypothetical protein